MTKLTKTSVVVNVMSANADKPMAVVLPLINAALESELGIPFKEGYAREWYVWVVQKKLAPGVIERKARPTKDSSTKEVPAKKLLKEVGIRVDHSASNRLIAKAVADGRIKNVKVSDDDIARIKAANLARMKAITARDRAIEKKIDKDSDTPVVDLDDDSFVPPKFLTKDQVKALV